MLTRELIEKRHQIEHLITLAEQRLKEAERSGNTKLIGFWKGRLVGLYEALEFIYQLLAHLPHPDLLTLSERMEEAKHRARVHQL